MQMFFQLTGAIKAGVSVKASQWNSPSREPSDIHVGAVLQRESVWTHSPSLWQALLMSLHLQILCLSFTSQSSAYQKHLGVPHRCTFPYVHGHHFSTVRSRQNHTHSHSLCIKLWVRLRWGITNIYWFMFKCSQRWYWKWSHIISGHRQSSGWNLCVTGQDLISLCVLWHFANCLRLILWIYVGFSWRPSASLTQAKGSTALQNCKNGMRSNQSCSEIFVELALCRGLWACWWSL